MTEIDRGPWLETLSGCRFHFLDPQPEDIVLEDIAMSLSRLCRYNGHSKRWYSVAEHTCIMADWVMKQSWATPLHGLTALHHDDAEFILGDLIRPIKDTSAGRFKEIEQGIDQVVALKFGTFFPFPSWLKSADSRILVDERDKLMHRNDNHWDTDELEGLGVKFMPISGQIQWLTRWQWLHRHRSLTAAILHEQKIR
jgi:hypothetical protein